MPEAASNGAVLKKSKVTAGVKCLRVFHKSETQLGWTSKTPRSRNGPNNF